MLGYKHHCPQLVMSNRGRTRERERERERDIYIYIYIPEFPKPLAPALRFGSMNPISRLLVHGVLWPAYYGDSERILVF